MKQQRHITQYTSDNACVKEEREGGIAYMHEAATTCGSDVTVMLLVKLQGEKKIYIYINKDEKELQELKNLSARTSHAVCTIVFGTSVVRHEHHEAIEYYLRCKYLE